MKHFREAEALTEVLPRLSPPPSFPWDLPIQHYRTHSRHLRTCFPASQCIMHATHTHTHTHTHTMTNHKTYLVLLHLICGF